MKTLELMAVEGHQMDDADGSELGVLMSTSEGELLMMAEPAVMKDAAQKMYLAADKASRLAERESEVMTPMATLVSAAPTIDAPGSEQTLVVSVSLGSGIPLSFLLSARDVDLLSLAIAKAAAPPPTKRH